MWNTNWINWSKQRAFTNSLPSVTTTSIPPQSPVTKCTCECIGLKLTGLSRHSCLICLAPVTASHEENSLSSNSSTGFLFSTAIQTNVISQWNTYGDSNSNWVICIAPPTEDWGCITIISLFSTFLVSFHLKCDSKQKKIKQNVNKQNNNYNWSVLLQQSRDSKHTGHSTRTLLRRNLHLHLFVSSTSPAGISMMQLCQEWHQ